MKFFRDPRWFTVSVFLAIIGSVPLIQMMLEVREESPLGVLEIFGKKPTAPNLREFEQGLEKANWLGRMTRPWVHFFQFRWLDDGAEKVVIGNCGWYFYKPGLSYLLAREEIVQANRKTNDPVAAIVDFRDQLAARGIQLLVMPVPNKEGVYPDHVTSRAEGKRSIVAARTTELMDQLRGAGVEVIDLFTVFAEARKHESGTEEPLYLAQDTHWSPRGVDLAAKTVAERLMQLGWVQTGDVEYRERTAPVRRLGDLLRMLQVPMIEERTEPEEVDCRQIVLGSGDSEKLYQDGAGAEILVIGDSFMRIYQQDSPTAAGFIAHLARELKQPMMSLVNDGGGSTLVRKELRGRPAFLKNKKVVIWEFVERDFALGVEGWKLVPLE